MSPSRSDSATATAHPSERYKRGPLTNRGPLTDRYRANPQAGNAL